MPTNPPRWSFYGEALVHCPNCDRRATVRHAGDEVRLTCPHCGLNQKAAQAGINFERYDNDTPLLGARLWLEAECCGGKRFWALNERHLDYIAAFITEKQRNREFPSPPGDRQIAYKFPRWMKLAKHRDEVLRTIERLRTSLA